jgi:hypothetical protein
MKKRKKTASNFPKFIDAALSSALTASPDFRPQAVASHLLGIIIIYLMLRSP